MQYVGGKSRLAERMLRIMLRQRRPNQYYVEPFVGGASVMSRVNGLRIANDINKYIIALYVEMQAGWQPPDFISEYEYYNMKFRPHLYPDYLVGFAGIAAAWGGQFFTTYIKTPGYIAKSKRTIVREMKGMREVNFVNMDYRLLDIPPNSIIYADPPYMNGHHYHGNKFNSDAFWDWCRLKACEGHRIYVSEYDAPKDFYCILEMPVNVTVSGHSYFPKVERLFRYVAPR